MKLLFSRKRSEPEGERRLEAERGRTLIEESRELVVVLDEADRVLATSRRAREVLEGLQEGAMLPSGVRRGTELDVPYEIEGRRETIVYFRDPGDMAAYEELRAGFTASVSHELRTPLARVLALLESAALRGADKDALIEQAQEEVTEIGELIDDVLFLSELESGREVVALGVTRALPLVQEVADGLAEQAARAGVEISVTGDENAELPLRPRMIRVLASNLVENAIRYAGPGATLKLTVQPGSLVAKDDGAGVREEDLPRLFERFYRADRARASRGTGLGLAIVKHIVNAAGGTVDATGARGEGLEIRLSFPTS